MRWIILIFVLLLSCTKSATTHHTVVYSAGGDDLGRMTLVFSSPAPDVIVAIEGKIVTEGRVVKRLEIHGVPSGYSDVSVAAGGVERKMRVWVDSGQNTSVPLAGPPPTPEQSPFLQAGLSVFALLVTRAASEWLF